LDARINALFGDDVVVVFDLNGLIVDDEPIQLQSTNDALNRFQVKINESEWISRCVGHRPKEYIPELLAEAGINDVNDALVDSIIRDQDVFYADFMRRSARAIVRCGVNELIHYCHKTAIPIALATGTTASGVEAVLGSSGISVIDKFGYIICGDQLLRSKPDPEIYLRTRDALGVNRHYVVLEDSASGVLASVRANMNCIAIPNSFTIGQDFGAADIILDSLDVCATIIS
jgi:beta-phosphoglucomutase-like phosphatase (HAD superfamily)